jgi:hypothetical protein
MKAGICTKSTQMGAFVLPGESHEVASLIMPFWVCQHLISLFQGSTPFGAFKPKSSVG